MTLPPNDTEDTEIRRKSLSSVTLGVFGDVRRIGFSVLLRLICVGLKTLKMLN
jgi:hypothetical protein